MSEGTFDAHEHIWKRKKTAKNLNEKLGTGRQALKRLKSK